MKLNYKRTFFIGLAFLSICAFWQMYDNVIPLMLQQTFHLNEALTGVIMAMDNVLAVFLLPLLGNLSDKMDTPLGRRTPFIIVGTILACVLLLLLNAANNRASLALFVIILFLLLIAMGLYRSPAVALMPDLTPKPLRSQGNAVINLMGALGGVYALILIALFTPREGTDYTLIIIGIAAIMIVAVVVLVLTIREKKLLPEVERENKWWEKNGDASADEEAVSAASKEIPQASEKGAVSAGRSDPAVRRSLTFILISIALWFMAYNAVTTAWSRYAITVWHMEGGGYANCLMVGTVAACISYIPVGIIASRIGRKKTILIGVVMLFISYLAAALYGQFSPSINIFFVLIGMGWAAINVNSLPMVVEMCDETQVGKYTGLYYTFSMSAQIVTPILSGVLLQYVSYRTLFPYACVFTALAFVTMMAVRHGDNKPAVKKNKLEYLDTED